MDDTPRNVTKGAGKIATRRWPERAAQNRLEPDCWPILNPRFRIRPGASVFTIGSCFARNIETHLARIGFDVPMHNFLKAHPEIASELGSDVLNRYTPPAIYQELVWARGILDRDDTVRMTDIEQFLYPLNEGKVLDLQRRGGMNVAMTLDQALTWRQYVYALFRHAFTADVNVITLGLIECWRDTERDLYVEFSPQLARRKHSFVFEQMDYPTAYSFVQRSIDLINLDGKRPILLTASPIPLALTFTGEDVIIANSYSKSVLRAVAGAIAQKNDNVDYFPSYESVMLTKRTEIWQDDLRHLEASFVGRIINRVIEHYVGEGAATTADAELRFIGHVTHGQWTEAAAAWSEVTEPLRSTSAEFHICAAEFLLHRGHASEAPQHLDFGLREPDVHSLPPLLYLRGVLTAEHLGDADHASKYRSAALRALGEKSYEWLHALLILSRGQSTLFPWLFDQAQQVFASDSDVLLRLARISDGEATHPAGQAIYQKVLQLEPGNAEALARLGVALVESSEVERAVELIPRLLAATQPDWPQVRRFVSRLFRLKKFAEIEPLLRALIESDPNDVRAHFWLARCVYARADIEGAFSLIDTAARLDPSNKDVTNFLARLERERKLKPPANPAL